MPVHNIKSYLHAYSEASWAVAPAEPVRVLVPHLGYSVRLRPQTRFAQPMVGIRERLHASTYRATVSGQLTVPLFGWHPPGLSTSSAQWLCDWGFADEAATVHDALALPSKSIELAEGPDVANRRHVGLRVNSTVLSGVEGGGFLVETDLVGKDEEPFAVAEPTPDDLHELHDFDFADAAFEIDRGSGYESVRLRQFQVAVSNNLRPSFVASHRITTLPASSRESSASIDFPKEDGTWDAYRRELTAGSVPFFKLRATLLGLHMGTGAVGTAWTRLVLELPKLKLLDFEDDRTRDAFASLPLQFVALRGPGGRDVNVTWTDL